MQHNPRRRLSPILAGSGITLLLAAALASCSSDDAARVAGPITGLETLVVAEPAIAQGRAWDGVVEAVQRAVLSAQTSGRVAEVVHDVNDRVAAGDVLVRLSAVEQQAEVDAARAHLHASEASVREAEANYQRYLELARDQHVSKAQLEQMYATRDAAVAARDAAQARLFSARQHAEYTLVRAPYDGIIASRDVEPGESVERGRRLLSLFSPDALRIEAELPLSVAEQVRVDPRVRVLLHDLRQARAQEVTVSPAADSATHAVRIRVLLAPLDPPPTPGSTAKLVFPAVAGPAHPAIPPEVIIRRGELSAVYVLTNGRLTLRQLRLGENTPAGVEVIAGLRPGETITTDPVAARQALVAARGSH